jgi:hypothetical protein
MDSDHHVKFILYELIISHSAMVVIPNIQKYPTLNDICVVFTLQVRKGLKLVLLTVPNEDMLKWWWWPSV